MKYSRDDFPYPLLRAGIVLLFVLAIAHPAVAQDNSKTKMPGPEHKKLGFLVGTEPQAPADLILLNGKVFTADSARPSAEAVAIRGECIVAVGTSVEIEKLAGAKTRRIDLQGSVVTPGFNDAHCHFWPFPKCVDLQFKTTERSWEETRTAIEQAVKETPPGIWIFGAVGGNVVLNEQVTRFELDHLAPNHPVWLSPWSGHADILNSKAMRLLQIAEEEPDPMGGSYERVPGSHQVNGRLWEYAEWKLGRILANQAPDEDAIKDLRKMADEGVRYGITSICARLRRSDESVLEHHACNDSPV